MSLNTVAIAGRLTKDLEVRHTQSGTAVASFILAVEGDYKDKQTGERPVYWVDCVAWSYAAEFMGRYLHDKGHAVIVDGHIETRSWQDKDGNKHKSTQVVADNVYFGDSKRDGDTASTSSSYQAPAPSGYQAPSGYGQDQFSELQEDDAEMPF